MPSTYTNLLYHFIFSTKLRVPLITPDLELDLYPYMGGIARAEDAILLDINGVADHVHLILKLKPDSAPSQIMKIVKGNSSKWANETGKLREHFEWQIGFAAFSVSESQLPRLRNYLARQKEHHKKESFKEELIRCLDLHRVPYDPRYIFD